MVLPALTTPARPVLLMVATAVLDDVHVTPELMSRAVPSLKTPVAENCCEPWLTVTDGFWGLISRDVNGEVVTLTVVDPEMPSELAEIVAEPVAMAVAKPELLMKTMAAFDVVHVGAERTFVLPFS